MDHTQTPAEAGLVAGLTRVSAHALQVLGRDRIEEITGMATRHATQDWERGGKQVAKSASEDVLLLLDEATRKAAYELYTTVYRHVNVALRDRKLKEDHDAKLAHDARIKQESALKLEAAMQIVRLRGSAR